MIEITKKRYMEEEIVNVIVLWMDLIVVMLLLFANLQPS